MIPLQWSTKKSLETTLLLYSRQALPRPARLYSTPSATRRNAYLEQSLPPQPELPPYMPTPKGQSSGDMHSFLKRDTSHTILPTLLPTDHNSRLNSLYFTNSPTRDLVAVINACLHNFYDVPRAKQIFDGLRKGSKAEAVPNATTYAIMLATWLRHAVNHSSCV